LAWEKRGQRHYYYRAKRTGPNTTKQYVGAGPEARMAARQDAEARRKRKEERAAIRRIEESVGPVSAMMVELEIGLRTLRDGLLLTAGYHQRRGEWRRRRGRKHEND